LIPACLITCHHCYISLRTEVANTPDELPMASGPIAFNCFMTSSDLGALAGAASKHLGRRVIVENIPGAAATVSGVGAVRAKPDGYTLGTKVMACA
jgi:hypothetical protein